MKKNKILLSLLFATAGSFSYSAGLTFQVQSVDGANTANSNAAEAKSPSTIASNPAGLTYLPGTQIEVNAFLGLPDISYSNGEGFYYKNHNRLRGSTSGKVSPKIVAAPGFYLSRALNQQITFGFGLFVPFGTDVDYPLDSVMRFNPNRGKITVIESNFALAFKIATNHSIGIGGSVYYAKAKVRQFADFTPGVNGSIPIIGQKYTPIPSGTLEGYTAGEGTGVKYGFNLGWLWDVNDRVRLGLSYHSKSTIHLEGDAEWNMYSDIFDVPVLGEFLESRIRAKGYVEKEKIKLTAHLPETVSLHGLWKVNQKLNLFGDITFTKYSRMQGIKINWEHEKSVVNAESPELDFTNRNYTEVLVSGRNTYKLSLGGSYQVSDPLELRFGIMYDKTAIKDSKGRTALTPDNDRIMLGLGANYQLTANSKIGVSYSFLKLKNAKIEAANFCGRRIENGPGADSCVSSRGSANAMGKARAHFLGVVYKYSF